MKESADTQIPGITKEIDEPRVNSDFNFSLHPKVLSEKTVKSLEQQKFEHGATIDKWATRILVGCVFTLVCVYVFERIVGHLWYKPTYDHSSNNLSNVVVETLKFLISSLIGFLFAKRTIP